MPAGKRDRRVTIQSKSAQRDAETGDVVDVWNDIQSAAAQKIEGSRAIESYAAQQQFATVTTVFRVGYFPWYASIRPDTHRVMFEGRPFNILGAVEIGRKRGVELLCVARAE